MSDKVREQFEAWATKRLRAVRVLWARFRPGDIERHAPRLHAAAINHAHANRRQADAVVLPVCWRFVLALADLFAQIHPRLSNALQIWG